MRRHRRSPRSSAVALTRALLLMCCGLLGGAAWAAVSYCVEVRETTALEPGAQSVKRYCPEIGLVVDNTVKLVDFDVAGADDEDD